ncbi:MAG: 1-deoxy-D-xylulose-5-phosphate reductoisomerase [Eubacterium sp.]|nr:1-deoxy-D-xylulose-5-phosphate reductoisomerase [Eubacterium sp.]
MKISIIGSTGSIGTQTLDVARNIPGIEVVALAAGRNIELLEEQMREFSPSFVSVENEELAESLRVKTADLGIPVLSGEEGLIEVACAEDAQCVVTAVVGMMGIRPTIAAIKAKKTIALANKETLVCAGHIIMPLAKECGVDILPVDSEHSAIFQSLNGEKENGNKIDKIILTASGGPFRGKTYEELEDMKAKDALNHPNWSMGQKVTIDSAGLINKGLEVMEARWLFDVSLDDIQVVVHPQSIVHSAVQYVDGAVIAQLGVPDMRLPIQYALTYPRRYPMNVGKLDFYTMGSLTFEAPDVDTFRGFKLAMDSAGKGGNAPTIFNAANENAVKLFLRGDIGFNGIGRVIEECMEKCSFDPEADTQRVLDTQREVNEYMEGRFKL